MRRIGIPGVESLGRRSVSSVSVSFTPVIEITITRGKIRRKDRKRGSTRSPPAIHPTKSFHPLRPPWVSSPPFLLSPPRKHVFVFVLRQAGRVAFRRVFIFASVPAPPVPNPVWLGCAVPYCCAVVPSPFRSSRQSSHLGSVITPF